RSDVSEKCAAGIESALLLVGDRRRQRAISGHSESVETICAEPAIRPRVQPGWIADAWLCAHAAGPRSENQLAADARRQEVQPDVSILWTNRRCRDRKVFPAAD